MVLVDTQNPPFCMFRITRKANRYAFFLSTNDNRRPVFWVMIIFQHRFVFFAPHKGLSFVFFQLVGFWIAPFPCFIFLNKTPNKSQKQLIIYY